MYCRNITEECLFKLYVTIAVKKPSIKKGGNKLRAHYYSTSHSRRSGFLVANILKSVESIPVCPARFPLRGIRRVGQCASSRAALLKENKKKVKLYNDRIARYFTVIPRISLVRAHCVTYPKNFAFSTGKRKEKNRRIKGRTRVHKITELPAENKARLVYYADAC